MIPRQNSHSDVSPQGNPQNQTKTVPTLLNKICKIYKARLIVATGDANFLTAQAPRTICKPVMGAPSTFSNSPRTICKPELTVELPCGCKMHYDCVLHELRAHEAYIFAEEHPHFACPKCRCEYSQVEQQAMEGNLSLYMPPDYICLIWDSNEGVHRRLAQINHTEDGPMLGRARTQGWWAKDTRPPKIYMNAIHPSYVEWGNSGFRTRNSDKFWDLWPRGPVRFTGLHADELTGAEVSNGADPAVWSWPNAGSDAPESCQQCEEASALEELLNRSKTDGHRHFAIYHCTTCDLVILDKTARGQTLHRMATRSKSVKQKQSRPPKPRLTTHEHGSQNRFKLRQPTQYHQPRNNEAADRSNAHRPPRRRKGKTQTHTIPPNCRAASTGTHDG